MGCAAARIGAFLTSRRGDPILAVPCTGQIQLRPGGKVAGSQAVPVYAEAREYSCALRFRGTKRLGFNLVLTP